MAALIVRLRTARPADSSDVRDRFVGHLSPWLDAAPSRVPVDIWEVKPLARPRAVAANEPEPRAALPLAA